MAQQHRAPEEELEGEAALARLHSQRATASGEEAGGEEAGGEAPSADEAVLQQADGNAEAVESAAPRRTPSSHSIAVVRGLDRGGRGKTTLAMWAPLRAEVERLEAAEGTADRWEPAEASPSSPPLSPLWFCYAAAQQRAERFRYSSVLESFDATVDGFCDALRALRTHTPPDGRAAPLVGGSARLVQSDARELSLSAVGLPLADAVLTSPPYAGVYDYLSHARESRARLGAEGEAPLMGLRGTPDGRDWPAAWRSSNEMGARKAMKKLVRGGGDAFRDAWDTDQRAWLQALRANLRAGGRAALLVGDGEADIDALESTASAAEAVGLRLIASATIASTAKRGERRKGRRRPEHVLLLENP